MKRTTLTLVASAMVAAAIAASPAVHAGPTSEQLCDAQAWPRPIPDVVGKIYDPWTKQLPSRVAGGALRCWDNIRTVTADGQDATKALVPAQQIATVSPTPGTPVGRDQAITLVLEPVDFKAPPAFAPCDWITTSEVAGVLGVPEPIETESLDDKAGSVAPLCIYRSPGHATVSTQLYEPLAFPIDAATEYATYSEHNATPVDGLGLAAKCLIGLHGAQDNPYNEIDILLDGNRMFKVQGIDAESCDTLKQLAQKAIGRI
jgi:hypothetical protein